MAVLPTPVQIWAWRIDELKKYGERALSVEESLSSKSDEIRRAIYELDWSGAAYAAAAESADREWLQVCKVATAYGVLGDACIGLFNEIEYTVATLRGMKSLLEADGYLVNDRWLVTKQKGREKDQRCIGDEMTLQSHLDHLANALDNYIPKISEGLSAIADRAPLEASAGMDVSPDEIAEINRTRPGSGPISLREIDIADETLSEQHFMQAEEFIFGEMKENANSEFTGYLKGLNDLGNSPKKWYEFPGLSGGQEGATGQVGAAMAFYDKVQTGGEWDHKPQLQEMFDLEDESDFYFKDPTRGRAVYYDIYSNIHYGYIGRAAGFDESTLILAANGGTAATGANDSGDDISMKIGAQLYDQYGPNMTRQQLHEGINRAMQELERIQLQNPDVDITQIRET